jgi:ring-1,2-phenylacetyl-CoA epoxidase subunit PaaD
MVTERRLEKKIFEILEDVKDPEIPTISLTDLGVITSVEVSLDQKVLIEMTPTFVGCPAMDFMKKSVEDKLLENGFDSFEVRISFEKPWTSNNITEKGKADLKKHGLAPPPYLEKILDIDILEGVTCPNCNSDDTELQTPFGPTLCRSIHFCHSCKQAFEQFKPL